MKLDGWKVGNFDKMIVKMNNANQKMVKVGIVTPKLHFRPNRSSIQVAQIYQWMEEGTKDGHVPPRPTLVTTFREYRGLFKVFSKNMMIETVMPSGNVNKSFIDIGTTYAKLVKHRVLTLSQPPLSPITIRTRVNRGTSNPLVDTGQLINAIGYSIR